MSKFIGNRFGSIVPIGPGTPAGPAVYNIFDHYYDKYKKGFKSLKQSKGTMRPNLWNKNATPPQRRKKKRSSAEGELK